MPFSRHLQALDEELEETADFYSNKRRNGALGLDPTSVIDKRLSPTSSSTLSSSIGSAAGGELAGAEKCALDDWEAMLSDSGAAAAAGCQDQSFLRWIDMGDDIGNGSGFGLIEPSFEMESIGAPFSTGGFQPHLSSLPLPAAAMNGHHLHLPPLSFPNPVFLQEPIEETPFILNQNPSFFIPTPQFESTKHPHFMDLNPNTNHGAGQQQQALLDQLFKAAELVEAGNCVGACRILARLNQQHPFLPSHCPVIGRPLIRSAFYFKEALLNLASNRPPSPPLATPLDVLLKLGTYKAFSEISPIVQFTNFTSIQAILEELNGYDRIHVVDFDVGVGGHWSSFMQELAHRRGGAVPSLRITAFASHSSHHPLELHLIRENLYHFANDLDIPFEFNVLSLDSFDPSAVLAMSVTDEAIAVNFPIGSRLDCQSIPAMLRMIRQLNPKIVVSVEHGCDRSDLSFSRRFLHAFQDCIILLDSIDASGATQDVANKIEQYLVQPRIENAVRGWHRAVEKMVPWRALFASAGFAPLPFSNFTETQAECLLKRVQVKGFQVEKRQASLFLCWQKGELISVSVWK